MGAIVAFFQGLMAKAIEPIIRDELAKFRVYVQESLEKRKAFEAYEKETEKLTKEMAEASTSEERWAILQKIKNSRDQHLGGLN